MARSTDSVVEPLEPSEGSRVRFFMCAPVRREGGEGARHGGKDVRFVVSGWGYVKGAIREGRQACTPCSEDGGWGEGRAVKHFRENGWQGEDVDECGRGE